MRALSKHFPLTRRAGSCGSLPGLAGLAILLWFNAPAAGATGTGADWPGHSGAPDESGYSQLDEINTGDIGRLGLVSSLDLPGEVTLEATPLAVAGVLYFTGSYATVYAVEAATGRLLWRFDPKTWEHNPLKMHFNFSINRGAAYADGRVFVAAMDGRLFALEAKTGKVLWSVETMGPKEWMLTSSGAPRTFKGKVIIGNSGSDFGARGYVTAYDQLTGKQLWRFYTAPGAPEDNKGDPTMERAAATWKGEYWKTGTGGSVWNGITFDRELNRIYLGTANAGPWDPALRSPGGGDNLFTASIVALDADTGKYVWHYQVNPRDAWDYDCTQQMTLGELVVGGKRRKVVMQAPKNGFFYALDRETGKLISAGKMGKVTWAERIDVTSGRPVEQKNVRYENGETVVWPSAIGGHNWQDMAFSPKTGLVYVPYMQIGTRFTKGKEVPGAITLAGLAVEAVTQDPKDNKGALIAWDPIQQKARWEIWHDTIWNGGALATAGGLVFQGTADGYFSAYDAANGKRLWQFNVGHGIIGGPISYSVKGKQYLSVLSGYGGVTGSWGHYMNVGWKYGAQPRRVLTFSLDGKAVLPPTAPPDMKLHALDNPNVRINDKDVRTGEALFMQCGACHGVNLEGAGSPAPDLRESVVALDPDAFWTLLHTGSLIQHGMPRFESLTKEQAQQLYMYIRAGARRAVQQSSASAN
jgi:quinohemoprotein ethanol dehydrogenase